MNPGLSLGHHMMKGFWGMGEGGESNHLCGLAYHISRLCAVGCGSSYLREFPDFSQTGICTKHFPHNFNSYCKALIGMCDALAIQVSLRGKTYVPRILYPNACLVPKPSQRIRSSKLSHLPVRMLPLLIFTFS